MTDTDDTDALLTCDPGGGLHQLLGRTMEGFSTSQLDSTVSSSDKTNSSNNETPSSTSKASKRTKKKNARKKKKAAAALGEKDSTLDVSDFFNSEGELVLSGLSQFSETSNPNSTNAGKDNCLSNSENGNSNASKSSSSSSEDVTTTATVESNTVVGVGKAEGQGNSSSGNGTSNGNGNESDSGRKISNTEGKNQESPLSGSSVSSTSSSALVKVNPSSVPVDIQDNLKRQILEANKNNPEVEKMLESNSTQIAYGVLNLNLNDLNSFAAGLSRSGMFPKEEKVSTFLPTTNKSGEQVFTRAPNFRTPGGYKPPQVPKKCRELTDEQIREEVRKMYAFPFVEDDEEEAGSTTTPKDEGASNNDNGENSKMKDETQDKTIKGDAKDSSKVKFNFLDGTEVPNEFGKGKSGKPIKRKLLPYGGGVSGGNVGSVPDLGLGVRNVMYPEPSAVKEPEVEKKTTFVTGSENRKGDGDDKSREKEGVNENVSSKHVTNAESKSSQSRFSFGYGEEESLLSPIRPLVSQSSSGSHHHNSSSSRFLPSPAKNHESRNPPEDKVINQSSLETTTTSTSSAPGGGSTSETCLNDEQKSTRVPLGVCPLTQSSLLGMRNKLTTPKRRLIRKAATKYRAMTSPRTPVDYEVVQQRISEQGKAGTSPMNSVASDLEKILSEIDLPAEEIEALIENFDEDDSDFTEVGLLDDIDIDGNLVGALSELKLDGWKSKGKDEMGSEAYYTEKFKREQCEKELRQLQESFLAQKQQNAVLEGTLKRRNMMLVQITMAFNRVCKEWKKFDSENKATVGKLQHDQKVLVAAVKHSKERISQYEKELHKTLELADSFKAKLVDVQKERDESVMILKEANCDLEHQIRNLKDEIDSLKTERDATLRALRESQVKLDESRTSLENMEAKIKQLENQDSEHCRKYDELLQAKAQQDSNYLDVLERRNELEALVMSLTTELNAEKSSKDQLRRDIREETERKSRQEAERLHEYYNKKVQDILKSATEEAARAESVLKDQMKRAALESERKLAECKEKYQREIEMLKVKYEGEIEKLKRENLHRQLLISSTVKQLQLGESSNLDINNALTVQSTRSQTRKDLFESVKPQNCQEACETLCKTNNSSTITKFTLDHLPGLMPNPRDDFAFGNVGNFTRYKTSTPVESQGQLSSGADPKAGGDFRKIRTGIGNLASSNSNDVSLNSFLEKVCGDKSGKSMTSVHSSGESTDFKNALSHLLEAPVKPEKEQQQQQNSGKHSDNNNTTLDPTLQKCIQDLLRSYADKFQPDIVAGGGSGKNNASVVGVGVNTSPQLSTGSSSHFNNRNDVSSNTTNKNEVEGSNNNNDEDDDERFRVNHSTSGNQASQQDCRSESRKTKGNKDLNKGQQQPSGQSKPPWK